jgi:hypothetical protein
MFPMRFRLLATLCLAAMALSLATVPSESPAQGQTPPPGGSQQRGQPLPPPQRGQPLPPPQRSQSGPPPQQPAQQQSGQHQEQPPKPYKAVAVTPAEPMKDPAFEAFRKQIDEIAQRKDRKALAGLVQSQGFFWIGERGDRADKRKPGIDNLARAIGLDAKDGHGWELLAGYASEPTAMPYSDRKDTVCAPADPNFNGDDFDNLVKDTDTDDEDWAVPVRPNLQMRAEAKPDSAVVETLGMNFLRVMPDEDNDTPMLRVVAPSGKVGFVPDDAVAPLANDQICYGKDGGGAWKIVGFIGGNQ